MRLRPLAVVAAVAVVLLAGCTDDGTDADPPATPASSTPAPPDGLPTGDVTGVRLTDQALQSVVVPVAAAPDGTPVLVTATDAGTVLTRGADGAGQTVTPLPAVRVEPDDLYALGVAPDGTAVLIAVLPETGELGVVRATVDGQVTSTAFTGALADLPDDVAGVALSDDAATAVVVYSRRYLASDDGRLRLQRVDTASGQVLAEAGVPGAGEVTAVATAPDASLTAVTLAGGDLGGDDPVTVVRVEEDLQPLPDVVLPRPVPTTGSFVDVDAQGVTHVLTFDSTSRLVAIEGDGPGEELELASPRPPAGLAVTPDGALAHVTGIDGGAVLTTVSLADGGTTQTGLGACGGYAGPPRLTASAVVAVVDCSRDGGFDVRYAAVA